MIKFEDYCCGSCSSSVGGCRGSSCPNRNVPVMVCDKCGCEVDEMWEYEGGQWCADCIQEHIFETLPVVCVS